MPSQRNVGWAQLKVGITAVVAFILLGFLIFLITGSTSFWEDKATLYTYLSDSAALAPGANVRLNGIYVGSIKEIGLSGESDPKRVVKLALEIQQQYLSAIPANSTAAITSENALGGKYINIKKGNATQPIANKGTLSALDTSTFDDVVASGYSVMESANGMLVRIDGIVKAIESGKGSLGKLLTDDQLYNNLNGTVAETRRITESINKGEGSISKLLHEDQLTPMLGEVRSSISRVNKLLDGLEAGQGSAGKLLKDEGLYTDTRATLVETRAAIAEIRSMAANLNAGKGSAGKLLTTDQLHNQLTASLQKMDTLLARINAGEGTLGQLVVNPQMYENLNGLSAEMRDFMKDFRANPKKFLSIKLGLF
jgi:phospholipid/cholesterol/gamma-HCH transport system substrate-binding protein